MYDAPDYSFLSSQPESPRAAKTPTRADEFAKALENCQDPNMLAELSRQFLEAGGRLERSRSGEVISVRPEATTLLRRQVVVGRASTIITAASKAELDSLTDEFIRQNR